MIHDDLIDLTEKGVFGISEHHLNENRVIPWLRNDLISQEPSSITFRTDSYTQLSYTISQTTSIGFGSSILTYRINESDTINTFWNNSADNIYYLDEFDDFGISNWSTSNSYTSTTSFSTKYYMLSGDIKHEDVFGKPIEKKKSHGRNIGICPSCGMVDDYIWTGHRRCDCKNHKNKNLICWSSREKEIERQKNNRGERRIPWITDDEIRDSENRSGVHRFRHFFGDKSAAKIKEKLLDQICWLNREKSYFGIGGKVDWVGIEERWEERNEEIAQILSGNTVDTHDVTI